ncbi:recombination protein RecT [Thalassospira sp. 11-3]|nr:recombination protein RecT [Thalassospira sp. 11-3]
MLPTNYSPENAVRAALLILQDVTNDSGQPALEVCTKESVGIALYDMVLQGLNPSKKQCYFKIEGNRLVVAKSYFGNIMSAKRDAGLLNVRAVTVYEKDVFEYGINTETGQKFIVKHEQKLANIDMAKIVGAYAVAQYKDRVEVDIMSKPEILTSWFEGPNKGDTVAHRKFPHQMGERTVINRLLKIENNSSNDADMFDNDNVFIHEEGQPQVDEKVNQEIKENANKQVLTMDVEHEEIKPEPLPAQDQEQPQETTGKKENDPNDPGF